VDVLLAAVPKSHVAQRGTAAINPNHAHADHASALVARRKHARLVAVLNQPRLPPQQQSRHALVKYANAKRAVANAIVSHVTAQPARAAHATAAVPAHAAEKSKIGTLCVD
jgi:hypothetical protein